jgi:hypothetical protein
VPLCGSLPFLRSSVFVVFTWPIHRDPFFPATPAPDVSVERKPMRKGSKFLLSSECPHFKQRSGRDAKNLSRPCALLRPLPRRLRRPGRNLQLRQGKSETLTAYLAAMPRFHSYRFFQYPRHRPCSPRRHAGFGGWTVWNSPNRLRSFSAETLDRSTVRFSSDKT